MTKHRHVLLNTSRWESETILEWLEYYQSIGFDHAYIYCNDDDPLEMYVRLRHLVERIDPFVTFHHMPYQGQQPACWMHFIENHLDECEWFMFVDADEFLALKPINSIKEFMKNRENDADCIHFNWIWFGPESFEERPSGSTLLQYTHREDEMTSMNYFTKTITRAKCVNASLLGRPPVDMLNHRWPPTLSAAMREVNVLGENMRDFFSDFPKSAEAFMADTSRRQAVMQVACLYHYLFRSKTDFKRRVNRGTMGAYYFQPIWGRLADNPDEMLQLLRKLGSKKDLYLHDFWQHRLASIRQRALASSIMPAAPPLENLALRSSPTQSSISPWSKGKTVDEDAAGAKSGVITGVDGFHTSHEERPWWMTDLGAVCSIQEIRVFNSLKNAQMAARSFPLLIELSKDEIDWKLVFCNHGNSPYGGADGRPLIVLVLEEARFVRLSLSTKDFFHLDEVEIYGEQ